MTFTNMKRDNIKMSASIDINYTVVLYALLYIFLQSDDGLIKAEAFYMFRSCLSSSDIQIYGVKNSK